MTLRPSLLPLAALLLVPLGAGCDRDQCMDLKVRYDGISRQRVHALVQRDDLVRIHDSVDPEGGEFTVDESGALLTMLECREPQVLEDGEEPGEWVLRAWLDLDGDERDICEADWNSPDCQADILDPQDQVRIALPPEGTTEVVMVLEEQ